MKYILYVLILCATSALLETYICDYKEDIYSCELISDPSEKEVIQPIEDDYLFDPESP
jgi:hypothetical protein